MFLSIGKAAPMLTSEQIAKFQAIYERRFGKKIDEKEAYELGSKLVILVKAICKPPPKRTMEKSNERRIQDGSDND